MGDFQTSMVVRVVHHGKRHSVEDSVDLKLDTIAFTSELQLLVA